MPSLIWDMAGECMQFLVVIFINFRWCSIF